MKTKMLKSIMVVVIVFSLIALAIVFYISKKTREELEKDYKQTDIDLTKVHNFINSSNWLLIESINNIVYALDWNPRLGIYGPSTSGVCTLISFEKNKIEYVRPRFNSQVIFNVDHIISAKKDESENFNILVESEGENYFYKVNKKGSTILKIDFENKFCKNFYIIENDLYFLVKEKYQEYYYLEKYDLSEGILVDRLTFGNCMNMEMIEGIIFSLNENTITVYDFNAEIVKRLLFPGKRESNEQFSSNNGYLYYLNSNGVYRLAKDETKFQLIFKARESKYFFGEYVIENFFVDSNGLIYFIVREGPDYEYSTILSVYNRK